MGYGRQTGDYKEFGSPFIVPFLGVSVAGTQATDLPITTARYRLPFAAKFVGASRISTTGGTAAGPSVYVQSVLAGTGTPVSVGTATFGTDASGSAGSFFSVASGTTPIYNSGDWVQLTIASGTAAATHTVNFLLSFVEIFA